MRGRGGGFGGRGAVGMGTYGVWPGRGTGLGMGRGYQTWPGNPYPYCRNFPWLPRGWWTGMYGPISLWQSNPYPSYGSNAAFGTTTGYGTYPAPVRPVWYR